jgi:AmiR/NasT family two-component response regulator
VLQDKICRLRISVIAEPTPDIQDLVRHLQRARASPRQVWPYPEGIGDHSDLVFCEYVQGLAKRVSWMPGEAKAALILLLPQNGQFDLKDVADALPDAVLYRPYMPYAIDVAVSIAIDHFGLVNRQRQRIQRLDESIKALRDIEKAKQIIRSKRNVDDGEAYRILREMAMNRRATIATIAERIIDAIELGT